MIKVKSRSVNSILIRNWIDANGPSGLARLSLRSNVSTSKIWLATVGEAPKKESTQQKLAKALGVRHSELFPEIKGKK